jgi:hypothetical protein
MGRCEEWTDAVGPQHLRFQVSVLNFAPFPLIISAYCKKKSELANHLGNTRKRNKVRPWSFFLFFACLN